MASVNLSVERLLEQEVDEINRFGEEKYIKPFTLSEQLKSFAEKINFFENEDDDEDKKKKNDPKEHSTHQNEKKKNDHEHWPWENIHSKLRIALSEMCILLDVLQCLTRKKYLVLDRVSQPAEGSKQTVQMLEKRKFLARAGATILKGASALQKENKPVIDVENAEKEYYSELIRFRQHCRVKKTGNQIIGDISFKTAGSKFWHPGLVEVKSMQDHNVFGKERIFNVVVGPDILQDFKLLISLVDHEFKMFSKTNITFLERIIKNTSPSWKHDILKAQEQLFHMELFSNLACCAFQGSLVGVEVINQTIKFNVLKNVTLTISCDDDSNSQDQYEDYAKYSFENLHMDLYNLQCKNHKKHLKYAYNRFQKVENSSSFNSMLHKNESEEIENMLETLVELIRHKVWVCRLKSYFEEKYRLNEAVKCLVSVNTNGNCHSVMVLSFVFSTFRSTLLVVIDKIGFKVHFDDSSSVKLPFEISSMSFLILKQVVNWLIQEIKNLSLKHQWNVVFVSDCFIGDSFKKILVNSLSLKRSLYFEVRTENDIHVESSTVSDEIDFVDKKFQQHNDVFTTLNWKKIPGDSFSEKVETLLLAM